MSYYINPNDTIINTLGSNPATVIERIAIRFMDDNPPVPVSFHAVSKQNFKATFDYMDEIRLHDKFPQMENESYAYAWAVLHAAADGDFWLRMGFYGPVFLYVNGELAVRSTLYQERFPEAVEPVKVTLKKGANNLVFLCIRTPLGCGFRIGSSSYKGRRIQFFAPSKEREGMGGFIYSEPVSRPLKELPVLGQKETETGITWYPKHAWTKEELALTPVRRIFGKRDGLFLAAAGIVMAADGELILKGLTDEPGSLYLDGVMYPVEGKEEFRLSLKRGRHSLLCAGRKPDYQVECRNGTLISPVAVKGGNSSPWIYAGPFAAGADVQTMALQLADEPELAMTAVPDTCDGSDYWYADMPDSRLRPYNEGTNYGEWNYPLGVTLYGLLQTGRALKDQRILAYIDGHMRKTTGYFTYCLWDQQEYGAAPFHNQLTTIESLDDCGSFGSAMLEYAKDGSTDEIRRIADYIAEYMMTKQHRLESGLFYRNDSYLPIMNETVWADDMYMSIPFLCRYYQLSRNNRYLEEAVNQAVQFDRLLYMADSGIYSHIYDVHYEVQTKVPWGRGNGWAVFSLSELLAVMEEDYPRRQEVMAIFCKLCRGYLGLQGDNGMWHQVLTMPESYPETSCTAMFLYAFARGVRYGWLEPAGYRQAAVKAWEGLCSQVIDRDGNLYGVCRGSGYSFSKVYYAEELPWNYNDTHGTGIVMLAGIELQKMLEAENGQN